MKQLQALFSLATDMLCVTDPDGRFLLSNPAFTRALGWSADELSATSLLDLVHPDDRESTASELRKLGSGEPSIRFENRCRQRDGGYRDLTWTAESDTNTGVVHAVARDVTAARQSLDRLMSDLPGMVYRCRPDDDWTMLYVSAGSLDLTGYTPEALLAPGHPTPASITFPEDCERVRQEVQAAIAENREYEIEYRLRTADGREKLVWERGRAITGENGALILQGFVADITERRMLRSELQQLQKMDALGQLTGGVAHDFNNLLTVVIGNLELMESIVGDHPEMTAHLGEAMEAAWRGVDLSQRLLAFSRKQMLAPEVISVNALIGEMEVLLRRTLGAGINIEVSPADGLPQVRVDPGQLENAILNLAINARDAMPNGGTMRIRTGQFKADRRYADARPDVEPGRYVMIEVADTGIGMTPDIRERAFEPFFTTKERGKGTGLGLSMVYGLLKQSGGHARVYSEPGQGTSVKLFLPETDPDVAEAPTNTIRLLREHGGRAERILVVEDDDAVRRLVVTSLKELGYRTMEASSGPEGLEVLEQHGMDIDLLLTDLVMPGGLNGIALARQARERFQHISVLLTSGFSEEHASLQGEFPLLSKPYRKAELALAVRGALDAESATGK
jgi:PAS domain S-box-containing protein